MKRKSLSKAMVLAAGLGTRLRPLTEHTPKALVNINGKLMIENVILKLLSCGIEEIIINTHYLSEQVNEYFNKKDFGIKIQLIHEKEILGTGGAIKNAKKYLDDAGNFLVHNADVSSDIDLADMYRFHINNNAFVTLAVKKRNTSRPLIIDGYNNLLGMKNKNGKFLFKNQPGDEFLTSFCGIHIISSDIFNYFPKENVFDIITGYMNLIKIDKKIIAYDLGDKYWKDLGKIGDL